MRDLTHFVWFSGDPIPDVIQSPGANFGFVCEGTYPEAPLEEDPIVLQARFDTDHGYQLRVFLNDECCPPPNVRRRLIEEGRLNLLQPRRGREVFVDRENCTALTTDWLDDDAFRDAVEEAIDIFVLANVA